MEKEQQTIEQFKVALENLNFMISECRKHGISLQVEVNYPETMKQDMLYFHEENNVNFKLHEAYKINKFK